MGEEARNVLADPQFGVARTLRPIPDFETVYQGVTAAQPIYFFPEGDNLDKLAAAETPGYDPTLARGTSVPFGSRVVYWLPNIFWTETPAPLVFRGYEWIFIWRLRSLFDFNQDRTIPYHFPRQAAGVPDTTAPVGQQQRVVIPAAYNTVIVNQVEGATELTRQVDNLHAEDIEAAADLVLPPIDANGAQAVEQGILDPAVIVDANVPQFLVHENQAVGDELILAIRRDANVEGTWDFAGADLRLARFLGTAAGPANTVIGAYVFPGVAP